MSFDLGSLWSRPITTVYTTGNVDPNENVIDWLPWQKKFAWKRIKLDNGETVWFSFYYMRFGRRIFTYAAIFEPLCQRGTLFDVLQNP